jgi:hypothetical protein
MSTLVHTPMCTLVPVPFRNMGTPVQNRSQFYFLFSLVFSNY